MHWKKSLNINMNIFNIFKKKQEIAAPVQKDEKKTMPFELPQADLQALYECSVQKSVTDFQIAAISTDHGIINVAADSIEELKGIKNALEANMAGQEVIFTYFARQGFIGFNNCAVIAQDWLVNKCVALPCEDAISIDYDINLCDEEVTDEDENTISQLKNISNNQKYHINHTCKLFAINKRKFGQALCYPIIDGADYSIPFNMDVVEPNSYKGMVVIEPIWVTPILDVEATTDPTSPRYYQPTWFRLPSGQLIHHSWFIFNTYGEISDILKPTYFFGGYPLPQLLYEHVYAAHKTAKEAPMLAQSKRLNYMDGNTNALVADSCKLKQTLDLMSWVRNNWGWVIKNKNQTIGQLDTSLADFDAVTMLGYQIVAAISGVQSARLLETSPKGWQSSGSLEDKNYSKTLESIQKLDYTPILELHFKLLVKSHFGLDKKYTVIFDPIDNPTEKEQAEIREINSRTDATYINAGVVSAEEVRGVLRADEKSGYNALSEEMEGEPLLDDEDDPFSDITGGSSNEQDPFQ